jgi:hypothetical protein
LPAHSDHVRRDAGHAARTLIRIRIMQYVRRMDDEAYSDIDKAIAEATREGEAVDGSAIGAEAANRALSAYGFERLLELVEPGSPPALGDKADGFA